MPRFVKLVSFTGPYERTDVLEEDTNKALSALEKAGGEVLDVHLTVSPHQQPYNGRMTFVNTIMYEAPSPIRE